MEVHTFICQNGTYEYKINLDKPNPLEISCTIEQLVEVLNFKKKIRNSEEIILLFSVANFLGLDNIEELLVEQLLELGLSDEELISLLDLEKLTSEEVAELDIQDEWMSKIGK